MIHSASVRDIRRAVELRTKMIREAEDRGLWQMEVGIRAEKAIILAAEMWLASEIRVAALDAATSAATSAQESGGKEKG